MSEPLLDLLRTVVESLTPPYPATLGDERGYQALLERRAALVASALSVLLDASTRADAEAQVAAVRDRLRGRLARTEYTHDGRYTPGPPVYGRFGCVHCGRTYVVRRAFCDECEARGVDVVRLDADGDTIATDTSAADVRPSPHPNWRPAPTDRDAARYTRTTAEDLTWKLSLPAGREAGWILGSNGLQLVEPPVHKRNMYSRYPRTWVLLADHRASPEEAQEMADRFIAGYLQRARSQPPDTSQLGTAPVENGSARAGTVHPDGARR